MSSEVLLNTKLGKCFLVSIKIYFHDKKKFPQKKSKKVLMTVGFEPTPWIGPEPKSGVLDLSTTSSLYIQCSHQSGIWTASSTFLDATTKKVGIMELWQNTYLSYSDGGKEDSLVPYSDRRKSSCLLFSENSSHTKANGINIHHLFIPFHRSSCQLPIKLPFRAEKREASAEYGRIEILRQVVSR